MSRALRVASRPPRRSPAVRTTIDPTETRDHAHTTATPTRSNIGQSLRGAVDPGSALRSRDGSRVRNAVHRSRRRRARRNLRAGPSHPSMVPNDRTIAIPRDNHPTRETY